MTWTDRVAVDTGLEFNVWFRFLTVLIIHPLITPPFLPSPQFPSHHFQNREIDLALQLSLELVLKYYRAGLRERRL